MKASDLGEESEVVDEASRMIFGLLMEIGDDEPGFAGAVLTLTLGRLLAMLDDEVVAKKCVAMHTEKAMAFRGILQRRPH